MVFFWSRRAEANSVKTHTTVLCFKKYLIENDRVRNRVGNILNSKKVKFIVMPPIPTSAIILSERSAIFNGICEMCGKERDLRKQDISITTMGNEKKIGTVQLCHECYNGGDRDWNVTFVLWFLLYKK